MSKKNIQSVSASEKDAVSDVEFPNRVLILKSHVVCIGVHGAMITKSYREGDLIQDKSDIEILINNNSPIEIL